MSDSFCHCTHMGDDSNQSSFSFAGTESKRGYHVLERTSHLHPSCPACHTPSSVCLELQRGAIPPTNWPANPPIHTHRSATAAQFDYPPFPFPPTLRVTPILSYASDSSPTLFGYRESFGANPLISGPEPPTVPMPTLTGHAQYGGTLIDAHAYHYESSFGFPPDDYMIDYLRAISSPSIAMPIVPTSLGASASESRSSHIGPVLPLGETLGLSPRHHATTFQHIPLSDSTPSLSPSGSLDSVSYSSPSPLSMHDHSLVDSTFEMSDQIQPQPYIATSVGQLYTSTVPLEAVEFPPISGAGEAPFFQCRWADCGIWIPSEKEAVKNHLTRVHNVVLKGKSTDSACCQWVDCSSSLQRNGLVRHFQTHLGLKWICSVCETAYTRQDSVGFHVRKEPRCQLARAVSYPSAVAYKARVNGDNTVTLTKILQP